MLFRLLATTWCFFVFQKPHPATACKDAFLLAKTTAVMLFRFSVFQEPMCTTSAPCRSFSRTTACKDAFSFFKTTSAPRSWPQPAKTTPVMLFRFSRTHVHVHHALAFCTMVLTKLDSMHWTFGLYTMFLTKTVHYSPHTQPVWCFFFFFFSQKKSLSI